MKFLIVDDDKVSRIILRKKIGMGGHEVVEAENGIQAWKILQNDAIPFIITDWKMPQMDGLELCERIRSDSKNKYVYVIVVTASDKICDLVKVMQSGADDYISKPFNPEELQARVETGLRILKLQDKQSRLEHILIESRNKLRAVFDTLEEQIVAVDIRGTIVSINQALLKAARCDPQDIVNQRYPEFLDRSENLAIGAKELVPLVDAVFSNGEASKNYMTGHTQNGDVHCEVQCLPIRDRKNTVVQVAVVIKDTSEDRRKAQEISDLNKRLLKTSVEIKLQNKELKGTLKRLEITQNQMLQSEKMASIGQLAAGVAHEINNPTGFVSSNLRTLRGYQNDLDRLLDQYRTLKHALKNDEDQAAIQEMIKHIEATEDEVDIGYIRQDIGELIAESEEGTERIKKIVEDLKHFAHPGQDKVQDTDINKELESTLNVVKNELKYKAAVVTELNPLPIIQANPQQLNQVFVNILVNAAQSIENMGEIRIKTRHVDGHVEIGISDTGCGIAKENISKIFDPFFTTKEVGKGTGLGMNIAYNIIKKHNGHIDVRSEAGKGTHFRITIPAGKTHEPATSDSL